MRSLRNLSFLLFAAAALLARPATVRADNYITCEEIEGYCPEYYGTGGGEYTCSADEISGTIDDCLAAAEDDCISNAGMVGGDLSGYWCEQDPNSGEWDEVCDVTCPCMPENGCGQGNLPGSAGATSESR